MFGYYKLIDKKVVKCSDGELPDFSIEKRRVALDILNDDIQVSTVFLVLDQSWIKSQQPLFFETMVFGGKLNGVMQKYATWSEAEKGHIEILKKVKHGMLTRWHIQQRRVRKRREKVIIPPATYLKR